LIILPVFQECLCKRNGGHSARRISGVGFFPTSAFLFAFCGVLNACCLRWPPCCRRRWGSTWTARPLWRKRHPWHLPLPSIQPLCGTAPRRRPYRLDPASARFSAPAPAVPARIPSATSLPTVSAPAPAVPGLIPSATCSLIVSAPALADPGPSPFATCSLIVSAP